MTPNPQQIISVEGAFPSLLVSGEIGKCDVEGRSSALNLIIFADIATCLTGFTVARILRFYSQGVVSV